MRLRPIIIGAAALISGAALQAHDTVTPHATRGDCERAMAEINNVDREWLYTNFPQLFSSRGKVMKHLNEDFKCEYDAAEDAWFIVDHRFD